jgi:hypothetical protein
MIPHYLTKTSFTNTKSDKLTSAFHSTTTPHTGQGGAPSFLDILLAKFSHWALHYHGAKPPNTYSAAFPLASSADVRQVYVS